MVLTVYALQVAMQLYLISRHLWPRYVMVLTVYALQVAMQLYLISRHLWPRYVMVLTVYALQVAMCEKNVAYASLSAYRWLLAFMGVYCGGFWLARYRLAETWNTTASPRTFFAWHILSFFCCFFLPSPLFSLSCRYRFWLLLLKK